MKMNENYCPTCGTLLDDDLVLWRLCAKVSDAFFNWDEFEPTGIPTKDEVLKAANKWLATAEAREFKLLGRDAEWLASDYLRRF
jgi:hypothetical protein